MDKEKEIKQNYVPRSMNKKQVMEWLSITRHSTLKSICDRLDITYQDGYQVFVRSELEKISKHWDL